MNERTFSDVPCGATDPDEDASAWFSEVIELLDRVARCLRPSFRSLAPQSEPGFFAQPDFSELASFAMRDPMRGTGWDLEVDRLAIRHMTYNDADEGFLWSFTAAAIGLPGGRSMRATGHSGGKAELVVEGEPHELRNIEQLVLDLLDN